MKLITFLLSLNILLFNNVLISMNLPSDIEACIKEKNIQLLNKFLSANKENVDAINNQGETPLIIALKHFCYKEVKLILTFNPNLTIVDNNQKSTIDHYNNFINKINEATKNNDLNFFEKIILDLSRIKSEVFIPIFRFTYKEMKEHLESIDNLVQNLINENNSMKSNIINNLPNNLPGDLKNLVLSYLTDQNNLLIQRIITR